MFSLKNTAARLRFCQPQPQCLKPAPLPGGRALRRPWRARKTRGATARLCFETNDRAALCDPVIDQYE
jgi:hypothetical protein